ncbi:uncharacterized protein LOC141708006 isoform X1 [Apium graveolens]|uniref:uncharacterized protein LOC141708006 isoform X1 n=1 Tax=Apium graveolens TaxID=4045 RepID=UPI003D7A2724
MGNDDGVIYETLTPLSGSNSPEGYVVFRNEISLDSIIPCSSVTPETSTVDYFSLDVSQDYHISAAAAAAASPSPVVEPLTPSQSHQHQPQRALEANWFRTDSRFRSPMLQLHQEILDFCEFLSPTSEEEASRSAAVESVFNVVKYIWPDCEVEVFGSFKTGLYLPSSDIDVVIMGSDIKSPQLGLMALSRALSQRGVAKKIQVIAKARVPIIKFVEKRSGISFDISFDVHNGPKAAEFIKGAISKWPPLRPLCLILKVFLQQRELNEVYSGGIGSYALLAMLIAMLRSVNDFHALPEHNLGVLLVNFFDIYGRKLNISDVGISCNGAEVFFFKSNKGFFSEGRSSLISIEDPQAPENDIGKNSFNYFQVRSAFSMAFSTLTNSKTILALGPNKSILGTIIRPDAVLLNRKGSCNLEVTFNKLLPGAGEQLQPEYNDQEGLAFNWQLGNEEEPLPRGNGVSENCSIQSSGKKRKSSKVKKLGKKFKDNDDLGWIAYEESTSRNEKSVKKKRWRHLRNNGERAGYGGDLSRTC